MYAPHNDNELVPSCTVELAVAAASALQQAAAARKTTADVSSCVSTDIADTSTAAAWSATNCWTMENLVRVSRLSAVVTANNGQFGGKTVTHDVICG